MTKGTCKIDGCTKPAHSRGWCPAHYQRNRLGRDMNAPIGSYRNPIPRFWSKVRKTESCWLWTAGKDVHGYGVFSVGMNHTKAHRWSYEQTRGPIPEGLFIDHMCHTPACVNPQHLRISTPRQNSENRKGPSAMNKSTGVRNVEKRMTKSGPRYGVVVRRKSYGSFLTLAEAKAHAEMVRAEVFDFPGRS